MLLWLLSSCDVFTLEEGVIYPTKYKELDIKKVLLLNEEYQSLNDNHICSTLNEFGFTGYSELLFENGVSPCASRPDVLVAMNEPDTLDAYVQSVILRNGKFTGVQDENNLALLAIEPYIVKPINEGPGVGSEIISWRLIYENQSENSVNIPSTQIEVIVDAKGVNRIWGNHYPEIYIPLVPNVDNQRAQEILNEFQNLQAKLPLCSSVEEIQISGNKKVIQHKIEDRIEIRIGWFAISSNGDDLQSECRFIVDSMDGSIIVEEPDSELRRVLSLKIVD